MSWCDVKLKDICSLVTSGGTPLRSVSEYYEGGTIPWMKTGEVKRGLVFETEEYITERALKESSAKLIPINSLIVAMYGDGVTAGNIAINKIPLATNQACCNFVVDPEKAFYKFIYYYLKASYSNLVGLKLGGSQQNLNAKSLKEFPLRMPELAVQKKIASTLSVYDDLIENNRRRIELLEQMAEELYREWFVRFRFPGYQQVSLEKGIPRGWKLVKLADAFNYMGGGTPAKEVARYWNEGTVNWFTPSDITASKGIFLNNSSDRCTDEGLANSSAKMFPAYSVMMTSRATIGAIGINLTPACTNQGFISCIPNENYPLAYLYHWLKLSKPHFECLSTGATFPELTKGVFKKIEILTPPKGLVGRFENLATPFFKEIESLQRANAELESTRSLLLTRLISGKLPVDQLDIQFPPSMREADAARQEVAHA
ncbi:restriction endonuclease subunit S [Pseudomonas sp. KHPS1]|nr:restriction endonuclease subunit S [Pseudomonas sp. KHPS1]UTH36721.1 restriction endonuclease subunit S [Pseudomonas sp. KHPS1]